MESNISRDHIAMEAMKVIIAKTVVSKRTIWNRIGTALGWCKPVCNGASYSPASTSQMAYDIADSMIEERERRG